MATNEDHLPIYGPGPIYVGVIAAVTVLGIALTVACIVPNARVGALVWPLRIVGALLIVGGVALWVGANFKSNIDEGITTNTLVTSGVYSIVRNPIYSAFSLVLTGVILIFGNLWLIVLPFVFWAFLTVLMKATEEKWLADLYGSDYADYCRRVNRCIPWFPRKGD